jgi:hypothetical protein
MMLLNPSADADGTDWLRTVTSAFPAKGGTQKAGGNMNWSPSRITFGLAFAIAIITTAAPASRAQICPGSNLFYLVRDAKGAIISAERKDLKYQGEATKQPGIDWNAQAIDAQKLRSKWRFGR